MTTGNENDYAISYLSEFNSASCNLDNINSHFTFLLLDYQRLKLINGLKKNKCPGCVLVMVNEIFQQLHIHPRMRTGQHAILKCFNMVKYFRSKLEWAHTSCTPIQVTVEVMPVRHRFGNQFLGINMRNNRYNIVNIHYDGATTRKISKKSGLRLESSPRAFKIIPEPRARAVSSITPFAIDPSCVTITQVEVECDVTVSFADVTEVKCQGSFESTSRSNDVDFDSDLKVLEILNFSQIYRKVLMLSENTIHYSKLWDIDGRNVPPSLLVFLSRNYLL